jgi:hypothetical protein
MYVYLQIWTILQANRQDRTILFLLELAQYEYALAWSSFVLSVLQNREIFILLLHLKKKTATTARLYVNEQTGKKQAIKLTKT